MAARSADENFAILDVLVSTLVFIHMGISIEISVILYSLYACPQAPSLALSPYMESIHGIPI